MHLIFGSISLGSYITYENEQTKDLEEKLASLRVMMMDTEKELRNEYANKNKIIKDLEEEWKTFAADLQKQVLSELHAKDTTIKEAREEREEILRGKLASQDEAIKKHEETLLEPLIKNSLVQMVYNFFPKCMHPRVAPKGILTGDELGTFMGTLVTTTAYNKCNNVVTHISQADMKKERIKGILKIIGKSVIWTFLGGLGHVFVGGFIKNYWVRLVVTAVLSLAMQCITAMAWKRSYEIPTWQPADSTYSELAYLLEFLTFSCSQKPVDSYFLDLDGLPGLQHPKSLLQATPVTRNLDNTLLQRWDITHNPVYPRTHDILHNKIRVNPTVPNLLRSNSKHSS
ncbi:unnamed protein product [Arabis nemorensis]|uniref:Uncharacterized protein n=1 Tax=Arabis nemorensis TaxID=586526 RepID=A0A565CE68_9BRAS|nr:unnamed protein product [Arabis nemorensis]